MQICDPAIHESRETQTAQESFLRRRGWQIVGVLAVCGATALGVAVLLAHGRPLPMDTAVYAWLSAHVISPSLTPAVVAFTHMSGAATLIGLTVVILGGACALRRWRIGVATAVNLAVEAALNEILKRIVARPRPPIEHRLIAEQGFSFPSGHAMASTAFYGFLIYLVYRYWRRAIKWVAIVMLALIPPIVMATRVYLGVHYASDVLAGCLYSIAYLTLLSIPIMRLTLLPPQPVISTTLPSASRTQLS